MFTLGGVQALGYTAPVAPVLPLPLTASNEKLGGAWEHGKDTQKNQQATEGVTNTESKNVNKTHVQIEIWIFDCYRRTREGCSSKLMRMMLKSSGSRGNYKH